jgi:hypothetical protein
VPNLWNALVAIDRLYLWSALIGFIVAAALIEVGTLLQARLRH